jgi:pantoate--beta-alanine ligase
MPVNIVGCATVREDDGLAMSSRNQQLDAEHRTQAASLFAALNQSESADEAQQALIKQGFDVDYVEDIENRRMAAASLGKTRLIDNVEI